jgi:hypothetical protein
VVPKIVYMTCNDLEGIPEHVIDNIKRYCKGYSIEIYTDQMCEDLLYECYGADAVQVYRELGNNKTAFWRCCIMYVKGGYYFDINAGFHGHIDDIPTVTKGQTWYYTLCTELFCGGPLITPIMNPTIWLAICFYYQHPDHAGSVDVMRKTLQSTCTNDLHPGSNIQSNGWVCLILPEQCYADSERGKEIRVLDLPCQYRIRMDPTGNMTCKKDKKKIAFVSKLEYHYECLGFLLDMYTHTFDVEVYHGDETNNEGYVQYFHKLYKYKSFHWSRVPKFDIDNFAVVISLTAWDPVFSSKDNLRVTSIHHVNSKVRPVSGTHERYIIMSPLAITSVERSARRIRGSPYTFVLPVYTAPEGERERMILCIGMFEDISVLDLLGFASYKIVIAKRWKDINPYNHERIEYVYNSTADELANIIARASFIVVDKKNNRLSGAISAALSHCTPMIIDAAKAIAYSFPSITYTSDISEIHDMVDDLTEGDIQVYRSDLHNYISELKSKNRSRVSPDGHISTEHV